MVYKTDLVIKICEWEEKKCDDVWCELTVNLLIKIYTSILYLYTYTSMSASICYTWNSTGINGYNNVHNIIVSI